MSAQYCNTIITIARSIQLILLSQCHSAIRQKTIYLQMSQVVVILLVGKVCHAISSISIYIVYETIHLPHLLDFIDFQWSRKHILCKWQLIFILCFIPNQSFMQIPNNRHIYLYMHISIIVISRNATLCWESIVIEDK